MSDSQAHSHDGHGAVATSAHGEPTGGHDAHDMHLGLYWTIGLVLIGLTGVTVWLSYFDFGSRERNIVVAMLVATFKVSLVGAIFMHLKGEKPTIWRFLYFTAFFVTGLFLLTALQWVDPIFGTQHNLH